MPITSRCRKACRARGGDPSVVHAPGEVHDALLHAADRVGDLARRREPGCAQPVVADHPLLVGVGDRPLLERGHLLVGCLQQRLPLGERARLDAHAAQVHAQGEPGILERPGLVALPKLSWRHAVSSSPVAGSDILAPACSLRPVASLAGTQHTGGNSEGTRDTPPQRPRHPRLPGHVVHRERRHRSHTGRHFGLLDEGTGDLRQGRAPGLVLLVPGAVGSRHERLRLSRGVPGSGEVQAHRHQLQLRHVEGVERRVLLGQPVHRLRLLVPADERDRAADQPGLPRQPGAGGRVRTGGLAAHDQRQGRRRAAEHGRDRHGLRPGAGGCQRRASAGATSGARGTVPRC